MRSASVRLCRSMGTARAGPPKRSHGGGLWETETDVPRPKPDCHEKMRVAMATHKPPSKHSRRGGAGPRVLRPGG